MSWYSPTDPWPSHSKPWYREALKYARRRGWWLRKNSDHSWATAYCSDPAKVDHPCKYRVNSTGRAGESAAKELIRLVDRCPHLAGEQGGDLGVAEDSIKKAENLLRGATQLLDHEDSAQQAAEARSRAEELIAEMEARNAEIEAILEAIEPFEERAITHEAEAALASNEAREVLDGTGLAYADPAVVLQKAEHAVDGAHVEVASLPDAPEVLSLRQRLTAAEAKLHELWARLSTIRPLTERDRT